MTLVGVVHDHPASTYRASEVVSALEPDVLALELPPLAVRLYEQYARDVRSPPPFGGEMSAAIQAASTDRVVGVDGPTPGFLAELGRTLLRERASFATARRVFEYLATATRTAVTCGAAASLASLTSVRLEVDPPIEYGTDGTDDPARQAADERSQIRRARGVLNALEPPRAVRFRDTARESYMSNRLGRLRHEGDVVAVVGDGHLDPLADRLEGPVTTGVDSALG
ncbi:hypothetical protein [Halorarum salinum]|uniref:hypothetical protein n=1 Tax=Halorarum salinum TaxID=2743089 RepID=UPI001FE7EF28|nr:hypothetical protein [Halobaculum salinum]